MYVWDARCCYCPRRSDIWVSVAPWPPRPPSPNRMRASELARWRSMRNLCSKATKSSESSLSKTERRRCYMRSARHDQVDGEEDTRQRLEALECQFRFPRTALAVQLSTARVGPAQVSPGPACRAVRTPAADARYRVFADLRGRGFYLTSAGKFGGDFLVYPGDPLRFHAHFICLCLDVDERVPLMDLLAAARLGSNVKKTLILCSPNRHGEGVTYSSLQWSGMV
ncbi:tRNA-splicing endonuclease subunit Sen34 isoform 2-T3 [Syngnathus typhle]